MTLGVQVHIKKCYVRGLNFSSPFILTGIYNRSKLRKQNTIMRLKK